MNQHPDVSVIIATCQREELALSCVASVLKCDYESYEIIVIDQDISQNLKQRLVQEFDDDRIKYFFLDKAGASKARNLGVQKALGNIVAFIDDDAVADCGWLKGIAEAFSNIYPAPALIGGRIEPTWLKNKPQWYPKEREYLLGLYNIGDEMCLMPEHDQPIAANMAGLRSVVQKLGGFDEQLGPNYFRKHPMLTGEETILAQRARKAGYEIYYQPHAKVFHQISLKKLTVGYFLKRHFWEGVTTIIQMSFLNDLKSDIKNHLSYHSKEVLKSAIKGALPNFRNHCKDMNLSEIRMLSFSKTAFSLGVLYGLLTLNNYSQGK